VVAFFDETVSELAEVRCCGPVEVDAAIGNFAAETMTGTYLVVAAAVAVLEQQPGWQL